MILLASSSLFCITTEVYGHFSIWSCSSHELHGGKKHNISHIILQSCCWVFFMWRGTEMGKQEHLFVDATVNQIWPNHTHTVVQEAAQWSFICSLFVSTWILFQDYLVVKNESFIEIYKRCETVFSRVSPDKLSTSCSKNGPTYLQTFPTAEKCGVVFLYWQHHHDCFTLVAFFCFLGAWWRAAGWWQVRKPHHSHPAPLISELRGGSEEALGRCKPLLTMSRL